MKILSLITLMALSTTASAANLCSRYESSERYMKAISWLAAYQDYSVEEFCTLPRVWDLQVEPSRIINKKGEVIPHVRIQQHYESDSCLYMINEINYTLSTHKCYSGT